MQVLFLSKFEKDLSKINQQKVLNDIKNAILNVEGAASIKEIDNLKKLKGFRKAYRVRVGSYRIGIYIEKDTVEFVRVLHRKGVYTMFP